MPDPNQPLTGSPDAVKDENPLFPPTYVKLYHDGFASIFDQRRPFSPDLGERICHLCDLKPGKRYLDICSGTGLYAQHPVKAGADVTCLEPDSELMRQIQLKFSDKAHYEAFPAQSYEPMTRFHAAGMVNGMHVLLRQGQCEAVMRRVRERILLPEGQMLIGFCDRPDMKLQPHVQFFQKEMEEIAFKAADTVRDFLENTIPSLGFSLVSKESVPTVVRANTTWLIQFITDRSTSTLQRIYKDVGPEEWQKRLDKIVHDEIPKAYPSGEVTYSYAHTLFVFRA